MQQNQRVWLNCQQDAILLFSVYGKKKKKTYISFSPSALATHSAASTLTLLAGTSVALLRKRIRAESVENKVEISRLESKSRG